MEEKNLENIEKEEVMQASSEDPILPDGWAEGDDFFNEKEWSGASDEDEETSEEENFFANEETPDDQETDDKTAETDPTTDPDKQTPPSNEPGDPGEEETPPTTEGEPPAQETPGKLKFKARIDHEDVEAEIDESELPTIYQKATATERYQEKVAKMGPVMEKLERVAKAAGYDSGEAMLDAQVAFERDSEIERLVNAGTPKEIAEDYVNRHFGYTETPAREPDTQVDTGASDTDGTPTKQQEPQARDFAAEVQQLWSMRPDLRGVTIPSEVAAAAAMGQNLALAYFAYEAKQANEAAENLRKENEVYKQNAAAAAKAPVRGVSGKGATDTQPKDPFLEGFDSDW